MNPRVGLRLAQPKVECLHRLQRMGLLINQNKQKLSFPSHQLSFRTTPGLSLPLGPFYREVARVEVFISGLKGRQQPPKFGHG
jgi:hypothetical protein